MLPLIDLRFQSMLHLLLLMFCGEPLAPGPTQPEDISILGLGVGVVHGGFVIGVENR